MFEPMFKPNPPYLNKAGNHALQVQIRECFPQPLKERLDEGGGGGRKKLSEIEICFSSKTKKAADGLRCVLSEGTFSTAVV